ncbi:C3HC4 type zinc-finger (RING finger) protein [Emydomyces testavorans]|uniref:RING-type E3 ubiquitin transferase n=1 Tax=Emydomyces testavorans TaxID=2070801 RepID=A0AAF0DEU4_9EURO|nr:C3HC4 type zinc-finger (RING finger) protein [Emydomyces testavorans]
MRADEDPPFLSDPPSPPQEPIHDAYDYPPDSLDDFMGGNITRHQFRTGDGRFTYTSTTFRSPTRALPFQRRPPGGTPATDPLLPLFANLSAIFQGLVASGNPEQRSPRDQPSGPRDGFPHRPNHDEENMEPVATVDDLLRILQRDLVERNARPRDATGRIGGVPLVAPNPLDIVAQIMGLGRHGDAVYSQEELDRVISELIDQTTNGNAPGPASEEAIRALPKKPVDKTMLGHDGKAECSICMDSVEIRDEVTELPCKHWFHENCISVWLNEHDTCPHCRKGIMESHGQTQTPQDSSTSRSPSSLPGWGSRSNPFVVPDSSPPSNSSSGSSGNGRFTGWMRNRFGGGNSHSNS